MASIASKMTRIGQAVSGRWSLGALALGLLLQSPLIWADDAADISKLIHNGQFAPALVQADAYLAQHPRDPKIRFLKGLILTEQNKPAEAIAVFTQLTQDYPDLPEPYNNLAVLYAGSGQYDKARAALDMAIRTNPSYATAYENLGDVHAVLASQAYDKALQLDSSKSGAKSKLTLLRTLAGNPVSSTVAPATPIIAAAPVRPVAAPPVPVAVPKTEPKIEPKVEPKPEPKVAKVEPQPAADAGDREEILHLLDGWAQAWSSKQVKTYLGYYSADFHTPHGQPRQTWADERRARISDKGHIDVKVDNPQLSIKGDSATVHFRQIYQSDQLKADSRKTLVLVKQSGKWQIQQERAGN